MRQDTLPSKDLAWKGRLPALAFPACMKQKPIAEATPIAHDEFIAHAPHIGVLAPELSGFFESFRLGHQQSLAEELTE